MSNKAKLDFKAPEVDVEDFIWCGNLAWNSKSPNSDKQTIRQVFEKLARTSPEIIKGFEPKYGWILDNPYAKVWVALLTL